MKKIIFPLAVGVAFSLSSCGETKTEEHSEETTTENHEEATHEEVTEEVEEIIVDGMHFYGLEQFDSAAEAISADSMYKAVMAEGAFEGIVKAEINEVCQKAGCWVKLKRDSTQSVMVFFKDHFGIPTETVAGTEAIMHGVAMMDTLSVDFQKHLLDDARENGEEVSDEEYAAITEDKIEVSFEVDGILVP